MKGTGMKGKKIIITAIAVSAILSLSACGKQNNDNTKSADNNKTAAAQTSTQVSNLGVEPGSKVKYDEPWKVVTDISAKCATAVSGIRILEKKYPGESVPSSEWNVQNNSMKAAYKECTPAEFNNWYKNEYLGWSHSTKLK